MSPEMRTQLLAAANAIFASEPDMQPHQAYNAAAKQMDGVNPIGGPSLVPQWFLKGFGTMTPGQKRRPKGTAGAPRKAMLIARKKTTAVAVAPAPGLDDAFMALFIRALKTEEGQAAIRQAVRPMLGEALGTLGEAVLKGAA